MRGENGERMLESFEDYQDVTANCVTASGNKQ